MKRYVKRLMALLTFSLLLSCAYSPQQITINPTMATDGEDYGKGRSVIVSVEDGRANKALGSRGGIYKNTSTITIANSLTDAIGRAAEARLAIQGFSINSGDAEAARLNIVIEELSYDVPDQSVGKKVLLTAILRVEASAGGETYTGRYRTNSERQTVVTPTMARNEKMINDLIADTLLRLFTDPKLKVFLSNI